MWKWLFGLVLVLLIGSNLYWFYLQVDQATIYTYSEADRKGLIEYGDYLAVILPDVARGLSKDEFLTIALKHSDGTFRTEPLEKDGCTWVGEAGFEFDPRGNLAGVGPQMQYSDYSGPCAGRDVPN